MPILRCTPQRGHQMEGSSAPSVITGSHIIAVWLGVLLINAAVMVAIFFPISASSLGSRTFEHRASANLASVDD